VAVTRYSYTVDLEDLNNSHTLAALSVPAGSRVLDLGAADGSVARALNERRCTVWGVEQDELSASAAAHVCQRVIQADLESDDVWRSLAGESFDAILALDVLEHLRDPKAALRRAAAHLRPGGFVVVSLPNVTHAAVRLSLLQGHFQYTETGLLDYTHLRFFDRASAERLMADSGLVIAERLRVSRAVDETEIPMHGADISEDLLERLARDRDATTYQFVFVARPADDARPTLSAATLSERLLHELEALRARFAELEAYAKSLEHEASRHATKTAEEVTAIKEELAYRVQNNERMKEELDRRGQEYRQMKEELDRRGQENRQMKEELDHRTRENHDIKDELGSQSQELAEELSSIKGELERRVKELVQKHLELRHTKADVAVKQAFVDHLRQQLESVNADAAVKQASMDDLRQQLESVIDDRRRQLESGTILQTRFAALEGELVALRVYQNSAGFRLVERSIAALKRIPFAYTLARRLVRKISNGTGIAS
jgi:methionine biosynthesis protein MetW